MKMDIDLKQAMASFAVANTPLFLVRKLQEDPAVRTLANKLTGEELLTELRMAVQKTPDSVGEAVLPFVCLVALSFKDDALYLRKSASIKIKYKDDWFDYARTALIQNYRPTYVATMRVTPVPRIATPQLLNKTNAASERLEWKLDGGRK